jgi:hypothetical protein
MYSSAISYRRPCSGVHRFHRPPQSGHCQNRNAVVDTEDLDADGAAVVRGRLEVELAAVLGDRRALQVDVAVRAELADGVPG